MIILIKENIKIILICSIIVILLFMPFLLSGIIAIQSLGFLYSIYLLQFFGFLAFVFIYGIISIIFILRSKVKNININKNYIFGMILLLCTMIVVPIAYSILSIMPRTLPTGSNLLYFDSNLWKQQSSTEWNNGVSIREKMLKDLLENVLPGTNEEHIINLLGPSLDTEYFKSVDKDLIYYLGPERDGYINIDSEWLLIWLDKNGIFEKYAIFND